MALWAKMALASRRLSLFFTASTKLILAQWKSMAHRWISAPHLMRLLVVLGWFTSILCWCQISPLLKMSFWATRRTRISKPHLPLAGINYKSLPHAMVLKCHLISLLKICQLACNSVLRYSKHYIAVLISSSLMSRQAFLPRKRQTNYLKF